MHIELISAPYDSGTLDTRMGAGPRHLLSHGLPERLRAAGHQVDGVEVLLPDGFRTEVTAGVELMRLVSVEVARARAARRTPILLSGNCGTVLGAVSGLGPARTGLLWFDAHGDLNTPETTPSGYFDGMGYAMLMGRGWQGLAATVPGFEPLPASQAALLGARDLDPGEERLIAEIGLLCRSPVELRTPRVAAELAALARRVEHLHVHLDPDVFDPKIFRGNNLPVPGGLEPSEVVAAAVAALQAAPLAGLSIASYDPTEDDPALGPRLFGEILVEILAAAANARFSR